LRERLQTSARSAHDTVLEHVSGINATCLHHAKSHGGPFSGHSAQPNAGYCQFEEKCASISTSHKRRSPVAASCAIRPIGYRRRDVISNDCTGRVSRRRCRARPAILARCAGRRPRGQVGRGGSGLADTLGGDHRAWVACPWRWARLPPDLVGKSFKHVRLCPCSRWQRLQPTRSQPLRRACTRKLKAARLSPRCW
jgi:hypothetical protein